MFAKCQGDVEQIMQPGQNGYKGISLRKIFDRIYFWIRMEDWRRKNWRNSERLNKKKSMLNETSVS